MKLITSVVRGRIKGVQIAIIFSLYFITRLFNLLSLPIFNDEAIYLHWGRIMVDVPNQAFYSLFDGKPPLILWNYGLSQKLPIDPLIAGRLVSIIFGFITLMGVIEVCRLLKFSPKAQFLAGLLYLLNPLFLFFDRLAILDGPVSTIFIWVLYFSLKISQSSLLLIHYSLLLGLVQGLGLWIKGTTKFFLFLPFIIPVLTFLLGKDKGRAGREILQFLISLIIAQFLFLPIRLHPLFQTFSKRESDFLLPAKEMLNPVIWNSHLVSWTWTALVFISPLVLIFSLLGFYKLFKTDKKTALTLFLFFTIPLAIEILSAKYFLSRYFLFTLVPLLIFSTIVLSQFKKRVLILLTALSLLIPVSISLSVSLDPFVTLKALSLNHILASDLEQYYTGWTSGYGIEEAVKFLDNRAEEGKIIVLVRADSGNPEDAMFVYLGKNKNILLASALRKPTKEELEPLEKFPIYFVSRGEQYLKMKDQLREIKIFKKPKGDEFIGVYQVKTE